MREDRGDHNPVSSAASGCSLGWCCWLLLKKTKLQPEPLLAVSSPPNLCTHMHLLLNNTIQYYVSSMSIDYSKTHCIICGKFFLQYINTSERVLYSLHQSQLPVYRARLVLITAWQKGFLSSFSPVHAVQLGYHTPPCNKKVWCMYIDIAIHNN